MAKTVNQTLAGGVKLYSKGTIFKIRGAYKKKNPVKKAAAAPKTKTFGKSTRTVLPNTVCCSVSDYCMRSLSCFYSPRHTFLSPARLARSTESPRPPSLCAHPSSPAPLSSSLREPTLARCVRRLRQPYSMLTPVSARRCSQAAVLWPPPRLWPLPAQQRAPYPR